MAGWKALAPGRNRMSREDMWVARLVHDALAGRDISINCFAPHIARRVFDRAMAALRHFHNFD